MEQHICPLPLSQTNNFKKKECTISLPFPGKNPLRILPHLLTPSVEQACLVWPSSDLSLQPPLLPPLTSHFIYILEIPKNFYLLACSGGVNAVMSLSAILSAWNVLFVYFASAATQGSSPQGVLSRCPRPGTMPLTPHPQCKHPGYTPGLGILEWLRIQT